MAERYVPIADYALIGDCHGAALVRKDGSIDWACLRRFDASPIFCRLLDADKGGAFSIAPAQLRRVRRRYLARTMVLETVFETETGTLRLLDAFTMRAGGRTQPYKQLVRLLACVSGRVELQIDVQLRFDYATLRPWLHFHKEQGTYSAIGGDEAIVLSTDLALEVDTEQAAFCCKVCMTAGAQHAFSLVWNPAHEFDLSRVAREEIVRRLDATIEWWRAWSNVDNHEGPYRAALLRSALVLKTLTTAPTGSVIAAPTTSLPETIGGARNWDYRYCWVRDAAFTMSALYAAGHDEVARGFRRFLAVAAAGHAEDMQILYGCYGERRLTEITLAHLEGYRGSKPVRVGNAAVEQRQLDVYGEFVNAIWLSHRAGDPLHPEFWNFLKSVVEAAAAHWTEPDQGLWEMRCEPRHFVYSKAMCWLALDRGLRFAALLGLETDIERWQQTREQIRATIYREGIDRARNCFVQSFGSTELDASLLVLPLIGFVDANDPLMIATVAAIERELLIDGFVRRYRPEHTDDGVGGAEGVFLMCTFWLVDVLVLQGRHEEAGALFERLLSLGNDVGLFAEEYDPATGELLGNFPQAFTHMSLINSARHLAQARNGREDATASAAQTEGDEVTHHTN